MSKTFRIVLILLVVISIFSATLAVFAFIGKQREYIKRVLLEDKLQATIEDKGRLEKELDSNKKAREALETKIAEMGISVKELSSQIKEVKYENKLAIVDLANKKNEIAKLQEDLEKEKREKFSISKKLESLESNYEKAKKDISRLQDERLRLEEKLVELKEKPVELDTIVVKPLAGSVPEEAKEPPRTPLRGMVLVVNRDYNFVVTDLGQDDDIKKGMVFEIREGTEFLGKAEIDKVYDTMSSATILPGAKISNIKKGNLVIESR